MPLDDKALDDLRIDRTGSGDSDRPRRRRLLLLIPGVLIPAAVFWWLVGNRATAEVRTAPARESASSDAGGGQGLAVLNASGYVTARRKATVSAKITGRVAEVYVEEGMRLTKGQVVARLDDSSEQRRLALADAELAANRRALEETQVRLAEAKLSLGRSQDLVKEGVASQAALDAARAEADSLAARLALGRQNVEVAARQVEVLRQDLDETVIRAPFDGVAISKDAQPGELISPMSAGGGFTRTGICTLVDMSSLEIEVDVNESYITRVTPNQPVEATLDAYPDWKIPAHVITTIPAADRQKATVRVRIAFEQLDPRILPDMGVKVAFLSNDPQAIEQSKRAVLVPKSAVRGAGDAQLVWVVKDDAVERRAVRVGQADGDEVQVLSGLAPGEVVVVEGPLDLVDGARVRVKQEEE